MASGTDSIPYIGDKLIFNSIEKSNCVLILGPLFGLNTQGEKINYIMKQLLLDTMKQLLEGIIAQTSEDSFSLDEEYQNLFIFEKLPRNTNWAVFSSIGECYEKISFSETYSKIAKIKFSAVLSFTQDTFLLDAFKRQQFEFIFKYFSANVSKQKEEIYRCQNNKNGSVNDKNNIPVLYNLFGCYQDTNSLIIDYTSFYKFLFAILGNEKAFPQEVISKLAEAQVFVFLGFDLKKWYVPLFITKLYNLGRDASNQNRPMAVASLNDTDISNPEYIQWLTRYPLAINFLKGSSQEIIERLNSAQDQKFFRVPCILNSPSLHFFEDYHFKKVRPEFARKISDAGDDRELLLAAEEIRAFFSEKNFRDAETFANNLKGRLSNYINKNMNGEVNNEAELNTIRNDLLKYINQQ